MSATPNDVKSLFLAAAEKTAPTERNAFLNEVCAGDAELRRQVEALLLAHDQPGSLLNQSVLGRVLTVDAVSTETVGANVGPYKLLQKLGEGGMGTVFVAEQKQPVKRRVAAAARSGAKRLDSAPQPLVVDLICRLRKLCNLGTSVSDGNTPFPPDEALESWLAKLLVSAKGPEELGRLGIYRVLRILGKGGMGLVLEAEDTLLKRRVALKVILPHLLDRKDSRQRFQREARAAAAMQCDYILPIHQVGEESGVPFLAMPLLHGESLEARLRRDGKLPLQDVLRLGRQIALGLAVAHEHGLIHRDIKPSNIWLQSKAPGRSSTSKDTRGTEDIRVKILDFGLARETSSETVGLSGNGAFLGTPGYMSPEQVDNQPLDGRSDLFSLGCVLYQMSTGKSAFRGTSVMQLLRSLSTDTPPAPRGLNRELPSEFSNLIQQLLAKDPSKRPTSAAQVAQRLAKLEFHLTAPAKPGTAFAGKGRWLALAASLLLFIGGGLVVGWQFNFGQDTPKDVSEQAEQAGPQVVEKVSRAVQADRRAAEWVLSIGGGITIEEFGKEREIKAVGELPAGAFELTDVNLFRNRQVSDAGLANFKDCKNLKCLGLFDTKVSDVGLANFKDCTNLISLGLGFAREVTDAGLANFKDCYSLTGLDLQATKVSDAGLAHFKNCNNLTTLYLSHTSVSDAGLAHFKDCQLTHLELGNAREVTDAGLTNFKGCKNLHFIQLNGTQVSDAGLVNFKDRNNLGHLDLNGTTVSDVGLANFKDCKKLGHLNLEGTQVSDAGLVHFKGCKGITQLFLGGTKVSDAGLDLYKDCKNLYDIRLSNTQVSDAALAVLASLSNLERLDVRRTKATAAGIAELQGALPKCKIEWDGIKKEQTAHWQLQREADINEPTGQLSDYPCSSIASSVHSLSRWSVRFGEWFNENALFHSTVPLDVHDARQFTPAPASANRTGGMVAVR